MFAAVMAGNMTLGAGWEFNSTIEHLHSATDPRGPFEPIGSNPVKAREAHNPSIAWDPYNKQYCLYYIGRSPIDGPTPTPAYPSGIADIAVTCAPTLEGPWQGPSAKNGVFPLVPHQITPMRWDNWIQNPEPVFEANGSVTLILNSNQHDYRLPIGTGFSHRGIAMASAPSWNGPFKMSSDVLFKPPNADGVTPWGLEKNLWIGDEDPCVFKQCVPGSEVDCAFHILTHQVEWRGWLCGWLVDLLVG